MSGVSTISQLQKSLETLCFLHQVFLKFPELPLLELCMRSRFYPFYLCRGETRGIKALSNEHNKTRDFSMDASFNDVTGCTGEPDGTDGL